MLNFILASSNTRTHARDCCTVSGWLIKWCDSFWLIWELSGHIHSENCPLVHPHTRTHRDAHMHRHTHTHTHRLTALTEAQITSGKMGPLLLLSLLLYPPPFFSLSFPFSCPLFSGCYLLPNLADNSPGNLMCVCRWWANDCTLTHPPTVDACCVFMTRGFIFIYFLNCIIVLLFGWVICSLIVV